jgi:hypothetical protein
MGHTLACSPTPYLVVVILVQWIILSLLLQKLPSLDKAKATDSLLGPSPIARLECATTSGSPSKSLLVSGENDSDSQAEGVFATVIFKAPKWFHLRYVVMLQNALSNLPRNWRLQIFINELWVKENLPSYHPGLYRNIASDPRISVTSLPDRLLSLKPKYTFVDPWFWRTMLADRVLLFSGNGAFCGNTVYDFDWLRDLDFVGVPSQNHNGLGGHGETHSYRNRTSMLRVLEYADGHNIKLDGLSENEFFICTMLKMNQEGVSELRLATPNETFRFGGVVNLTDASALTHLPLVVSGTMARLAYEERDSVLKHCPEIKVIFPSLHEPACFGAHPDPAQCRLSICALQESIPSHGC